MNKIIAIGSFAIIILFILTTTGHILDTVLSRITTTDHLAWILLITLPLAVILTALFFPGFQRFVEKNILQTAISPAGIIGLYANSVTQITNLEELSNLLKEQVTPNLSIQQSALMLIENKKFRNVYADQVEESDLPQNEEIDNVLQQTNRYRPIGSDSQMCCRWARLILTLNLNGSVLGVWLLGKRRTDDIYSQIEIETLRTLCNATAITIGHITQAEKLSLLSQEHVNQAEAYRAEVAYEIHARTLNDLANLKLRFAEINPPEALFNEWDRIVQELRQTVNDLRPSLLNYDGVRGAVRELIDSLEDQYEEKIKFVTEIEGDSTRYLPRTEEHLYRIVQQLVKNAINHSKLTTLTVRGQLTLEGIDFIIEDDGTGFEVVEEPDIIALVSKRHFGLADVYERAKSINASVRFDSAPNGKGTRVYLKWKNEN